MTTIKGKSIYLTIVAKAVVWGALALCATSSALLAQEQDTVWGHFTLQESARFGNDVLGAGQYKFSIEPVGTVQSMRSIEQGVGHLVLVVLRPEKTGRVTTLFAMASPSNHESNELILGPEKTEARVETLYLQKEGLAVDFHWSSAKAKSQVIAQQSVPVEAGSARRSGGTE